MLYLQPDIIKRNNIAIFHITNINAMKRKILFGISLLFGLLMINSGLNKFFNYMPLPEMPEAASNLMTAFAESGWVLPLLGVFETLGGILIILPKTRALGAIMLVPIVVGILWFHLILEPSGIPISIILCIVLAWIIIENKSKYMPMISS